MPGSLRLAASSLFLVFTIFSLTLVAQTPDGKNTPPPEKAPESFAKENNSPSGKPKKPVEPAKNPDTAAAAKMKDSDDRAATAPERYRPQRGRLEYNFEPGFAPFEPTHFTGEKTYNTAGRKLGTTHFRVGRVIGTNKAITFTYLLGVTPLVVARANEVKNPAYVSAAQTPPVPKTVRETSYGIGFSPAHLRFTFFPKNRFKPFVQIGAGVLFFNRPVPIPESRRMQFTGEYGGGFILHIEEQSDRFMTLGYRYYHISNANIGGKQWNPGYNASVFYVGYSIFK